MTAEVRLVDADELRRRIDGAIADGTGGTPWGDGHRYGLQVARRHLDAMPTTTAPKGWTRDEVLAELAKHPDNVCEALNPIYNEWEALTSFWIEQWHPEVRRFDVRVVRSTPDPEWVPLHEVIGRTLPNDPSCDANPPIVDVKSGARWGIEGWFWTSQPFPHDDASTLWTTLPVTSDGTVAVRPEAAT